MASHVDDGRGRLCLDGKELDDMSDYYAKIRQKLRQTGLDLTVSRGGDGFTGGQMLHRAPEIEQTVQIISLRRQTAKAVRRELGGGQAISGRQWKRARRALKQSGHR